MHTFLLDINQFIGRLHPLVLHLPIGILVIAFILAFLNRNKSQKSIDEALGLTLTIGSISAILAAITGYILAGEGGYEEVLLGRHKWLGIATAAISILAYIIYRLKRKALVLSVLSLLMLVLLLTGHMGGSLTHGVDFLIEPFQPESEKEDAIENINQAIVFQDFIHPILKEKCNRCHNESKLKGDLLLSSIMGIKNGGKNGALFVPGDAEKSLMMQRIHLPVEEKKHMPPKGKKQLTDDEVTLLAWWIEQGGSFDSTVESLQQPEDVQSILKKYIQSEKDVLSISVEPASEKTIQRLESIGIEIKNVAKDKPFLVASLKGRQDVDKRTIKKLKGISSQLVSLDLSNSNADDQILASLSGFEHLQKLFLQKTQVTSENLKALGDLEYLEYLNLVETTVDDASVDALANMKGLKNLYLWQTNVSPEGIASLVNQRPRLNIDTGADKDIFGSAQLNPPFITSDQDIFTDSLLVTFDMNFKNVNLYYTLDGKNPDTTSIKYDGQITLRKTSEVRVIAHKSGWQTSEPASRYLIRAKYQPTHVQLNAPPHPSYPGEGAKSLTDFKKGTTVFRDGNWLGYEKGGFTATFDMGKVVDISRVTISALEATDQWIFFPKGMHISVSQDGKSFLAVKDIKYPMTPGPEPASLKNFSDHFEQVKAQFVKVKVQSHRVNPAWHPAPGEPCWVFIDEIMIE